MQSDESDVLKIIQILSNEVNSPVIETYEKERIERINKLIVEREEEIKKLKSGNEVSSDTLSLCQILSIDISRMKYYLTYYQKIRLMKIQKMINNYINGYSSEDVSKLSEEERAFFKSVVENRKSYFEKQGLNSTEFENKSKEMESNFVFVRVLSDIEDFKISDNDEEELELQKGQIFLLPYTSVKGFINTNTLELI